MARLAILISGNGSNLQAIVDACEGGRLPGIEIAVVVSNRREAYGLTRAQNHGLPTLYFPLKRYRDRGLPRSAYDADLARLLLAMDVDWVVQAGWMHILSNAFLSRFPNRVLNLHPALPGQFPGVGAIARAYEAAVRGEIDHTGVMVHLVPDEGVDVGPVVLQEAVPIHAGEDLEALEARVHAVEHRLLVESVRRVASAAR